MRKLIGVTTTALIGGTAAYTYINNQTQANKKNYNQHLQQINSITASQSVRTNPSKSGDLTSTSTLQPYSQYRKQVFDERFVLALRTGDKIYIKLNYLQTLQPMHYFKGFFKSLSFSNNEFNSYGYVYKSGNKENGEIYFMYNQFGDTVVRKYTQFIQLPYFQKVFVCKNIGKYQYDNYEQKLSQIIQKQLSKKNNSPTKQTVQQMINRVNQYVYDGKIPPISDINQIVKDSSLCIDLVTWKKSQMTRRQQEKILQSSSYNNINTNRDGKR